MNEIVMEITPEMEGERIDNCIIYVCLSIFDDLLNIRSG